MTGAPATETTSPRFHGIDSWPPGEALRGLWESQLAAVGTVGAALPDIERAVAAARQRLVRGGRLAYAGAGTSARIAMQDAVELEPTFGWPSERMLLLIAGGEAAIARSVEDAEDDAAAAAERVARHAIGELDVVVGIAASGTTPYSLAAVAAARAAGALTVAVACVAGSRLSTAAEIGICLPTGAEAIAGSTRLSAGTAQKVALNLFSTLLMIRLGHVHDGLMVDMQPRNAKLRQRGLDMVMRIAGSDADAARYALSESGGNVKRAVLLLRGVDRDGAERLLSRSGNSLRAALAELAR